MITRHHVALTIICTLILCSAQVPASPIFILVICLGAALGTILPDIQMKRPRRFQIRTFAWGVTRFGSILCTPLICLVYRHLTRLTIDPCDKRVTHSVPGILCLFTILAVLLIIPVSIVSGRTTQDIVAVFLGGVLLGLILHLVEDLCTKKGISPLFPFSTTRISGSIRPCDENDRRIAQFHYFDCSMAGVILCFQCFTTWQGSSVVPICLFGLGSCLGMMVWSSDVEIRPENERDKAPVIVPVVMLDPISFPGKPRYSTQGLMMGVYYFNHLE